MGTAEKLDGAEKGLVDLCYKGPKVFSCRTQDIWKMKIKERETHSNCSRGEKGDAGESDKQREFMFLL